MTPEYRTLSAERFERARDFMLSVARPLDRAIFRFAFETGSSADVAAALETFQNDDGGFGNAIEPDIRLPGSSVLATTVGLQVVRSIGLGADDPIVERAVAYLVERYDPAIPGWRALPVEANAHPHAPWWTQADPFVAPSSEMWGNPNAEVLGCLFEFAERVPTTLIDDVARCAREKLDSATAPLGTYAILCYLRGTAFAPDDWKKPVLERLRADAAQSFAADPEQWGADLQPFWLAPAPASENFEGALADVLEVPLRLSLDREIDRQSEDGSWRPRWSWGSADPAWDRAESEWAGEQTLRTLEALHRHGRIPSL